jgi:hypothetical protein
MSGNARKDYDTREAFTHEGLKGLARRKKDCEKWPDGRVKQALYH